MNHSIRNALFASTMLIAAAVPALAADVTPQRLVNPNAEPQNWLMNHRTYDGQRFSPLARINKDNVKNLKLAYAVPLGGLTGGAAVWVPGPYDPATNQTLWGTGNPVPMFDPFYRPGDNLYTNSAISWDPESGAMN